MNEGVEWGLHCCLTLSWLEHEQAVPSARLAALFGVSPTYLNKCLQRLTKAGLLSSTSGPHGGVRLARAPKDISLMDVVSAVEGRETLFCCTEIRQQGLSGADATAREFAKPCGVATAMRRAELAWRRELAGQTIADLIAAAPPGSARRIRATYDRLSATA